MTTVALSDFQLNSDFTIKYSDWEVNTISSFSMEKYLKNLYDTHSVAKDRTSIVRFLFDIGRIGYGPNIESWPGFKATISYKDATGADKTHVVDIEKGKSVLKIASRRSGKGQLNSFTAHSIGLGGLFYQLFIKNGSRNNWKDIPGISSAGLTQFMTMLSGFEEADLEDCFASFTAWVTKTPGVKARDDEVQKKVDLAARTTVRNTIGGGDKAYSFQKLLAYFTHGGPHADVDSASEVTKT